MNREEETIESVNLLTETVDVNPKFVTEPGCLIPILSDIAISLARIADALTERGQDDRT